MKNDHLDEAFIGKCRNIDFSNESTNQEKNLAQLKSKINDINLEREIMMNRKVKRPLVFAAAVSMLLCFFIVAYGRDLIRIVKTIKLGEHAEFQVLEGSDDAVYLSGEVKKAIENLPEEVEKVMEKLNKDGFYEKDGFVLMRADHRHNLEFVKFHDAKEGQSYFICDTLMPTYLPDGYEFDRIEFLGKNIEELMLKADEGVNKYMSIFYSDGENEIYSQVRYMDEKTAFKSSGSDVNTLTINNHHAVLDGNSLNIMIGNVMYYFRANGQLDVDELVKMAESLQ